MVKRNTDYKQVFLVDEFYLKHFNLQNQNVNNTISNNPKISLTTPQSSQYFNNHYNIPTHILNPTNLQRPVNSTFDNQKYYNNSQSSNLNKTSEISNLNNEREYNDSNLQLNDVSKFQTENPNVNGTSDLFLNHNNQIPHETDFRNNIRKDVSEEDEVINPPDPFLYYDNYQQDQDDEFSTNKAKNYVSKTKNFLNKTQKQLYMCYICKQTFNSILLLEKHIMMTINKTK